MRLSLPIFILVVLVTQTTEGKKTKPADKSKVVTKTETAKVQEESHQAHDAAADGDVEKLKSILKKNPQEAQKKDKNGWQAIHEAARAGHADVASMLVTKYGVDVNERTVYDGKPGGTPLYYAEKKNGSDHPIVAALKKLGAVNISPEIPDHHEAEARGAAADGDIEKLKSVLEKDDNAHHKKDQNGWQAIHEAARAGHTDVVSMLVKNHGANVNERTLHYGKQGGTPLYYAEEKHGSAHPIVDALKKLGAINLGPEL